ncbi:MAG: EamA family transporter [Chloroflexota bacterium]
MKTTAYTTAILSALLFGAATPLTKPLLSHLSSNQMAGLLYLGAALGVSIILIRERKMTMPWRLDSRNATRLIGAIFFGGVLGPLALMAGLRLASAASVSMWLNLEMVATAVLGHLFFKDHLTKNGWFAAGGILAAAILLAWGEGAAGFQAGLLVALACLCWGIDNHLTALIDGITPAQVTFWKGLVAGSTNLAIGMTLAPLLASGAMIFGGLVIGALAYGVSIVLYIASAQQLGATRSQLIFSSAPLWGVLLALLVLGERFTPQLGLAIVLFVVSITILFREQHSHAHVHIIQVHEHEHSHTDGHHDHAHEGIPAAARHSHTHQHEPIRHAHPHLPDLHHRHSHNNEDVEPAS